ncbi:uncharacterized protein [Physcomitrium patens]|uniref:Uncharacterized protein n=1 Tax=Physcomitrium patens TaxID=3218 RepID=A0A2K1JMU5_PHYPA|nr:hypothetical protein PHYPA_017692 [Physcomitrium patens]
MPCLQSNERITAISTTTTTTSLALEPTCPPSLHRLPFLSLPPSQSSMNYFRRTALEILQLKAT